MVAAPRIIPDAVRATQARASDPAASAFVSANAGSGKTHVLVQRVIRLLLDNVPPEKILCITFTKAAAANMAKRVFDTLAAWAMLDDADDVKRQKRERVFRPGLFSHRVDAGQAIDALFDWRAEARQATSSVETTRDIAPERANRDGDQGREDGKLQPTFPGHREASSEWLGCAVRRSQPRT